MYQSFIFLRTAISGYWQSRLEQITIYPAVHLKDNKLNAGLPGLQTGAEARKIIDYLGELSAPFGTRIEFEDGVGVIRLSQTRG